MSNTFFAPAVCAGAAGSAWTTAEPDRCRRVDSSDEEELEGEAVARRGTRASWRRKSVEAILDAGESAVVVVVFDVVGAKPTVLIRWRRGPRMGQAVLTVP